MRECGFSSRTAKLRNSGFVPDLGKLGEISFWWLSEQRTKGTFQVVRSLLGSIDFTYTSHRTTKIKTYGPTGG